MVAKDSGPGPKGKAMLHHKRFLDRKVYYAGDTLIREGDYGDCAYYVQNGQIGVFKRSGDEDVLITVLPDNSIVGEMALIDNRPRSATVRCLETATVVVVNRAMFEGKMRSLDPFMRALLEMFSQKIRRLNEDYCGIEQKLQWLLRQTGLPPLPSRGRPPPKPPSASAAEAAPDKARLPVTTPEAATARLDQEGIDRFDRVKLELAMLYHPDCIHERGDEAITRADAFREIWRVLTRIEEDTRTDS